MAGEMDLPEAELDDGMGTIILMLGLYLIVLAFFILLNAISEDSEKKQEEVSASLAQGFGFQVSGENSMRDNVNVTINPVFEVISSDLENVIETHISVKNYNFMSSDDKMLLKMDPQTLFIPEGFRIKASMVEFFGELADVVSNPKPGFKMEVNVIVGSNKEEIGVWDMDPQEFAGRRASLMIRAFEERGAEPKLLSASAVESERPEVKIFFSVLVADKDQAFIEARKLQEKAVHGKQSKLKGGTPEE